MKKTIRVLFFMLLMTILPVFLCACGSHPATEKEVLKMEEKYEKGKISYEELLEAHDAYYNGEPIPKKGIAGVISSIFGFISNVFGFIGELIGLVFGLAVIFFIIRLFRKK